jgi:membrane protease YdiL (CAAX protease family)
MAAQTTGTSLDRKAGAEQTSRVQRIALFVLFLICGLAVFVFGSSFFTIFPTNNSLPYNLVLAAVFLIVAVWFKHNEHLEKYWRAAFAFFVATCATLSTLLLGGWNRTVLSWFNLTDTTSAGMAIAKVYEMLMIVVPIIMLTKLSGADLGSIYLKRGNLKWGLGIGGLVFFNFATSALLFFATRYTSLSALGAAIAWGLVFALANGFLEELWVRGIFLKRYEPLLGMGTTVFLTSIVFAVMHAGAVEYLPPQAMPFMLLNTLTLGLACGYLMMKTDSLWGSVLIHAAADLFLFIATLAAV